MKSLLLFTLCIFFTIFQINAQTPNQFKYQAVVRNSNGEILNKKLVSLRISILQNSASGSTVYSEVFDIATNEFGVISANIGSGAVVSGTFSSIPWGASTFYLQVEIDIQGTSNYTFMGTSQILAVPYAMYAIDVKNNNDADADPTNEIQDLQLVNNILTITKNSNATQIPLSQYVGVDTDQQSLSVSTIGSTVQLGIQRGNTINFDLPSDFVSKNAGGTFGGAIHATNLTGAGNLNLLKDFSVTGAGSVLLFAQGNTNITLPMTGTLATETFVDQRISLNAMSATHAASAITSINITNWNTAYSWGNHNGLYRPLSYVPTWSEITSKPNFALVSTSGSFADLLGKPTTIAGYGITDAFNGTWISLSGKPTFASIATTGSFADLLNKPTTIAGYGITDAFNGSWTNLTGKPTTIVGYGITDAFNGTWTSLTGKPNFAAIATSGSFTDLTGKPTTISGYGITDAFNGTWTSLTGKPTTISGFGITDAFDGTWTSLTGKPTLATVATSGSYTDLSGKPTLATVATSGNYSDLAGKPGLVTVATTGNYSDLTGTPTLATVATSGSYTDLTNKPTLSTVAGSGLFSDIGSKPTTLTGYGITDALSTSFAGSTSITTLGTIGTGTWNGTKIDAGYIDWTSPGNLGSTTPNTASFTNINISTVIKLAASTQPAGTLGLIYLDSGDSHLYFYGPTGWVRLDP